jgi:hypothetical protein
VLLIRNAEGASSRNYQKVRDKEFVQGMLVFQEYVKELAGIIEAKEMYEWFCASLLS